MTDAAIIEQIERTVKTVEAHGFGEVVIKIRNGNCYRILCVYDTLLEINKDGSLCQNSEEKSGDIK